MGTVESPDSQVTSNTDRSRLKTVITGDESTPETIRCYRHLLLLELFREDSITESEIQLRGHPDSEIESDLLDNHLPCLEAAGYIVWNRETGEITKGPKFEEIEPLLDLFEQG